VKDPIKLLLYTLAAVVVLVVAGLLVWNFDPFKRRHNAEVKAASAEVKTAQAERTTHTMEQHYERLQPIIIQGAAAEQAVQAAPGATVCLDTVRRAVLCRELSRLRDDAGCAALDRACDPAAAAGSSGSGEPLH